MEVYPSMDRDIITDDETLDDMVYLGIPLSKVGAVLYPEGEYGFDWPSNEQVAEWVDKIKTRGLAGLSLFSINKENNRFFGNFAKMIAELLYL